jgi:glycosyltransferase involved in cell wall biosynthesis
VTEVVAGAPARVVFHHHDLPWQRREDDHLADEFPPRVAGALHVTVNLRSRRELRARGYDAVAAIPKHFDFDAPRGDRDATRAAMGFADDDLVVFQPTRAIERKNVPGGVRFAQRLASVVRDRPVRYWLRGPVGDEYAPVFERLLERAPVPVTLETTTALADSYAAADLVVLPSTWENFGRATVDSAIAGRPVVVFPYPVLGEIAATGVRSFPIDDPTAVARFLREPADVQARYAEVNAHRARLSYALPLLPETIGRLFAEAGWSW